MRRLASIVAVSVVLLGAGAVRAENTTGYLDSSDSLTVRALLDSAGWRQVQVKEVTRSADQPTGNQPRVTYLNLACANNRSQLRRLPALIGRLPELTVLILSGNALTDLPAEVGNLRRLTRLDLDGNDFGEVPSCVGKLTALQTLTLNDNSLGALDDPVFYLHSLTVLEARRNAIAALPGSLGLLEKLQSLALTGNGLRSIPASIGSLDELTTLLLDSNELTDLPAEVASLLKVKVNVNANRLCDALDAGTKMWLDSHSQSYEWRTLQKCASGSGSPSEFTMPLDAKYNAQWQTSPVLVTFSTDWGLRAGDVVLDASSFPAKAAASLTQVLNVHVGLKPTVPVVGQLKMVVSFPVNAAVIEEKGVEPKTLGVYYLRSDSTIEYVGGAWNASKTSFSVTVSRLGMYALMGKRTSFPVAGGSEIPHMPLQGGISLVRSGSGMAVSFSTDRTATVTVRMLSCIGRMVRDAQTQTFGPGAQRWDIALGPLAADRYMVEVLIGSRRFVETLVLR